MVTRHDIENQAIQRNIEKRLEDIADHLAGITDFLAEIPKSLIQIALVVTEYGIHEGFLDPSTSEGFRFDDPSRSERGEG